MEVISDDASRKARSIKDVTNYFETNHPELLGPLLKRTIVVMNHYNKLFTYKPPSKLEWLSSNNNDGLHSCLDELFQYLTLKYALSHPPFLIGFDYNKKQNTLGEDKVGYEREMRIGAQTTCDLTYSRSYLWGYPKSIASCFCPAKKSSKSS